MASGCSDYLANVMPVMQRSVTVIADDVEVTCTAILSTFATCAAVMAVPGAAVSQHVAEKLVNGIAVPGVMAKQYCVSAESPLR